MKIYTKYFLLALLSNLLCASDMQWDREIIEKIISSLQARKTTTIQVENSKLCDSIKKSKIFHIDKSCEKVDFVLTSKDKKVHCDKPHVVFNYHEFLSDPDAVAVFFWQKGRPTIRFSSKKLEKYGLHVNGELSKFVSHKY